MFWLLLSLGREDTPSLFIRGAFFFLATLDSHVVRQHSIPFSFLPARPSALHLPLSVSVLKQEFILMEVRLAEVLFNPRVLLAGKEEKFQFWAANQSQRSYQVRLKPI